MREFHSYKLHVLIECLRVLIHEYTIEYALLPKYTNSSCNNRKVPKKKKNGTNLNTIEEICSLGRWLRFENGAE